MESLVGVALRYRVVAISRDDHGLDVKGQAHPPEGADVANAGGATTTGENDGEEVLESFGDDEFAADAALVAQERATTPVGRVAVNDAARLDLAQLALRRDVGDMKGGDGPHFVGEGGEEPTFFAPHVGKPAQSGDKRRRELRRIDVSPTEVNPAGVCSIGCPESYSDVKLVDAARHVIQRHAIWSDNKGAIDLLHGA